MKRRTLLGGSIAVAVVGLTSGAVAQQAPIKIGMSMAQTGGLAGGGKASLLGIEIWRDDINAKGGLLGRKVELVVYDDKSSASETPAIYSKLIDVDNVDWQHRAHFFAVSAQIMRRILLDQARRRVAAKRGGAAPRANLDEIPDLGSGRARELIALDDGLNALAALDPRKARVIELRFFGGLSAEETGEVLKVSADTVLRDWKLARAWLLAEMSDGSFQDAK